MIKDTFSQKSFFFLNVRTNIELHLYHVRLVKLKTTAPETTQAGLRCRFNDDKVSSLESVELDLYQALS